MPRALFLLLASLSLQLPARDIHVGRDAPTIAHAIKAAAPGDTIHLEPKVYFDYAGFYGKHGQPGKPIVLDGHGATLDGSDPLDPALWKEVEPGLFKSEKLLPRLDDAMLMRWFFVFNGHMQFMGRTSKGAKSPLKTPDALQPGEWTFVQENASPTSNSKLLTGAFFIRIPTGSSLASANIRIPVRSAGVQFGGTNSHLIIRNLTATRPYNDGFNIHGDCHDVVFENIAAIDCGDDGISAHETARYQVDGFISMGNSTGICDTGRSITSYHRVFISRCIGYDLFFLDHGKYHLSHAIIHSSAQNPFTVTGREDGHCTLTLENVIFKRTGPRAPGHVSATASVTGTKVSLQNFEFTNRGTLSLEGQADETAILSSFTESMRTLMRQAAAEPRFSE